MSRLRSTLYTVIAYPLSAGTFQLRSISVALCAVAVSPLTCAGTSPITVFVLALTAPVPIALIALALQ